MEVVVTNGQLESGQLESHVLSHPPERLGGGKEIRLIMCEDIGCFNFRFSTASLTEGESLLHLFKLECQDPQCEGLDCNRGCYKSVIESCHIEVGNSDMCMLNIEFRNPVNFVCKKCVDVRGISLKLPRRKSPGRAFLMIWQ